MLLQAISPLSRLLRTGCLNLLAFVMLLVACQLPESLNYPKAELLKKEAAARQTNGRSLGMTPLARQPDIKTCVLLYESHSLPWKVKTGEGYISKAGQEEASKDNLVGWFLACE